MTLEEIDAHLREMDDDQLKAAMIQARDDLAEAADHEPESEWHQACFAAALTYAQELSRRGIRLVATH
jgi:hypothetical protein